MAIRQYVGARYVPKFYEGSNGNEWDSGVSYEALTVVTYLNCSYTSKKPVPARTITPNLDTEYWIMTSSLNADILELKSDVADIKAFDSSLLDGSYRKYVFISDSYGEVRDGTNWILEAVSMLGLTSSDYYEGVQGGFGFYPGYAGGENAKFISLLQGLNGTITDKDEITDIVVGGGFNDRTQTIANLKTAISDFCTYAKANYPNAKIWVAGFGWSFNSEFVQELNAGKYLNAYKSCGEYGAIYITGSDYIMHNKSLFLSESQDPYTLVLGNQYVHPNASGSKSIAGKVVSALLGGNSCGVLGERQTVTFTLATGVTLSGSAVITQHQNDNMICWENNQIVFHIPNTTFVYGSTAVELGTLTDGYMAGGSTVGLIGTAYGFIVDTGNVTHECCINIFVRGNKLFAYALVDNITAKDLVICNFQKYVDCAIC